jgi:anti-sigma-K factor RskA
MSDDRPDERELEQSFSVLQQHLPRVSPRHDLFTKIEESVESGRRTASRARPRRRRGGWRFGAVAVASAAAVAIVAVLVFSRSGSPALKAVIEAHAGSTARGSVEVFAARSSSGHIVLRLTGLPVAPRGDHYTVWVLRAGTKQMTPVGSFFDGRRATFTLPLPGPGVYQALDISLQRNDASPVHSAHSVAGATLG